MDFSRYGDATEVIIHHMLITTLVVQFGCIYNLRVTQADPKPKQYPLNVAQQSITIRQCPIL